MKHLSSEPKRSCWVSVEDKGVPGEEKSREDGGPGSPTHPHSPSLQTGLRGSQTPKSGHRGHRHGRPSPPQPSRIPTSLSTAPDGQGSLEGELLAAAGDRCRGSSQDQVLGVPGEAEALHGGKRHRRSEDVGEASRREGGTQMSPPAGSGSPSPQRPTSWLPASPRAALGMLWDAGRPRDPRVGRESRVTPAPDPLSQAEVPRLLPPVRPETPGVGGEPGPPEGAGCPGPSL